jgi:O-6-methylguanine DNA methyltransferase
MNDDVLYRDEITSPIGRITLLSTERGVCHLALPGEAQDSEKKFRLKYFPTAQIRSGGKVNTQAARELEEYFSGKLREFHVPVDLRVTGFRRDILGMVKKIAFGKTRTYGELARAIGKPRAARAVGGANGANPIPIIIPCHRVVAGKGLGGYGGGLPLKKKLLQLEGVAV